jgi:hypothetical protein
MRMLYVDVNLAYINPTANLAPMLMQAINQETTFYGPGFVSQDEIDLGIQRWCELTGPYDVIIIGSWTPIFADEYEASIEQSIKFIKQYAARSFKLKTAHTFFYDIQQNFKKIDVPLKIYYGLTYDYYATSQAQIDKIDEFKLSLIAPNHQFSQRLEDLPQYVKMEPYYHKKVKRLSNAWQNYLCQHPEKVITATHFISPNEFSFNALAERKSLISVPGAAYHLRKEAIRNLRAAGYYNIKYSAFSTVYKIADRFGFRVYSRAFPLKLYNYLFWQVLSNTKYVYTARGSFGTPVRKFFEIPAAGALLICTPCLGYDELGFNNNEHYIEANPDKLIEVLNKKMSECDGAQKIASAGRRLVASKHSLNARANQIRACLIEMINGSYLGSYWDKGRFVVKKQDKDGKVCDMEV